MPHKLGQVFLKDNNIIQKILASASIMPEETIVEIGCGAGILTQALATKSKTLYVYEIDKTWLEHTQNELKEYSNIHYIHQDVLKQSFEAIPDASFKIVANIPYYISAKILKLLITNRSRFTQATLMVQKEFAQKLVAPPGDNLYTSLSLYTSFHLEIKTLFTVSKNSFKPVPKVDSMVIQVTARDQPLYDVDETLFFNIIRSAFWGRRKTLINCLSKSPYLSLDPDFINAPFLKNNPKQRGENLSLEDFHTLYQQLRP